MRQRAALFGLVVALLAASSCGGGDKAAQTVTVTQAAPTTQPATTAAGTTAPEGERPTSRVLAYLENYQDGQLKQWVEDVSFFGGEVENVGGEAEVRGMSLWLQTNLSQTEDGRTIAQHLCNVAIEAINAEDFGATVSAINVFDKDGYELKDCPRKGVPVELPAPETSPSTERVPYPDPELPDTTEGTTACGAVENVTYGASFDVFVVSGPVTCAAARQVVADEDYEFEDVTSQDVWQYIDWTKGGNGVWTDVWSRRNDTEVIGAILKQGAG